MKKAIAIALVLSVGGLFAGNEASKVPMIVYRGELFDADGNRAPDEANMRRDMKFNFYDTDASGAPPLCSCELRDVPINPDGSFEAILADKYLPGYAASGQVTHVGLQIGSHSGVDKSLFAAEISPRRELRPLVGVNRALVAEAGTSDMRIGVLAADALEADWLVVNDAEVSGPVTAETCDDAIEINPVTLHEKERTTLLKGNGVTVFARGGSPRVIRWEVFCAQRGELCKAPADGVALVHTPGSLAIPGVVQFYRKGDAIRSPISANGVRVTFWEFAKGGNAQ